MREGTSGPGKLIAEEGELLDGLLSVARRAVETGVVRRMYFARLVGGRRFHHVGGYGEETFFPPERFSLGRDWYVFVERVGWEDYPEGARRPVDPPLRTILEELRARVRAAEREGAADAEEGSAAGEAEGLPPREGGGRS
ncbi:hypothetical protein [Brockia lithotrophica]|uniref:Uncharacterized protein n=1 Tax=Brockia lithotrophica TaxID=933949 RepID=A0A660L5F9_9BACL|nr:hypothetical protein [Brockia lithotrophica]RKQ88444.1 hypothetical protein C7438_0077 [Brockia lithotrophica]